ncbi:MAG: phosphoenolpyruvate synthase [Anaerolineae bacterium]|nr:phosphoenolpyruvate synthase [Anaerolineae bacterium]
MTEHYTLRLESERATLARVGGKGAALAEMARAGLPVPDGFHVVTGAYQAFVAQNDLTPAILAALEAADPEQPASLATASRTIAALFAGGAIPPEVAGAIANAYGRLAGADPVVAVRSSATAEDLPEASFAGQQETFLNVAGTGDVLDAVKRCWASLWTARAIGYRARRGIGVEGLALAVVVQCMVPAEAAGILFTANPLNGRRNEAVINAAWGLGTVVVGGEVTPDMITVEKGTGEILDRQIAEKRLMTVPVAGGAATEPVPEVLRKAPVLDDAQAVALVQLGIRIEELYGDPRDIEWALEDGVFVVLQARPITALPEPAADLPETWPAPDPQGKYMRGSIVDLMPDPLTPLFQSMGLPAIAAGMKEMVREMIGGSLSILDDYLITINDYVYLNADFKVGDLWWVLVKMLPALPRLMGGAARHWEAVAHPGYVAAVAAWEDQEPETMTALALLDGAQALADAMGRYLTTLQVDSLGIAAGTEMLFTRVYGKLIRREGDPPAPTYLLGFNSLPIQAEKALYDLAQWCREHDDLTAYLQRAPVAQLSDCWASDAAPPGVDAGVWQAWGSRFQDYLERYGHSIYDLDFAEPIPVHDPTPPLQTLQVFVREEGRNPHARQQRLIAQREAAIAAARERVGGLRRKLFDKTLGWAQTYTVLREDSIFEIGLGYPILRRMLLELGRRLAKAGALQTPDDIFWLERAEAEQSAGALDRGEAPADFLECIETRKRQWRAEKRVTPPPQLPKRGRILGMKTDIFMPVDAEEQTGTRLKGTGCSPGRVTATARVLHGPEDFDQMRTGDILVADITTPAWTPLFAMAAGIVTNIGGPLSHGSIVAREYGIPAVLGTGVATRRIESGQRVAVDGDAGTVTLLEH